MTHSRTKRTPCKVMIRPVEKTFFTTTAREVMALNHYKTKSLSSNNNKVKLTQQVLVLISKIYKPFCSHEIQALPNIFTDQENNFSRVNIQESYNIIGLSYQSIIRKRPALSVESPSHSTNKQTSKDGTFPSKWKYPSHYEWKIESLGQCSSDCTVRYTD